MYVEGFAPMSSPLIELLKMTEYVTSYSFKMPCIISVYEKFRKMPGTEAPSVHQSALPHFLESAMLRSCEDISQMEISALSEAIIQR